MLERLEISEILFSKLYSSNRIDAETYRPFYLEIENMVKSKGFTLLGDETTKFKKGIFDIKSETYTSEGIPFVRISNLRNMGIDDSNIIFIPESENNKNLDTFLSKGDVILSKTGVPAASIVQLDSCNTSQDTVAIKLKKNSNFLSSFLVTFLNSKFGYLQMQRWFTGNIQTHLNLTDSKSIFLPHISKEFQQEIDNYFWRSFKLKEESKLTYKKAENSLLQGIGLLNFQPSKESVNVKNFMESFGVSGRLDADYYQKKYEQIESNIKINDFYLISEVFNVLSNSSPSFYTENGVRVIKTKNIRIPAVEIDNITDHTNEERILIKKGDLLFASMGVGSLGRLSYIDDEIFNCTTDGTIRIFRTKDEFKNKNIEIPTLLFLTSKIGQELIYKYVIGSTGIISISKENIAGLIIPKVSNRTANNVTELVLESQRLKTQSEKLLEIVKRSVEIAIEQNEETALNFITQSMAL